MPSELFKDAQFAYERLCFLPVWTTHGAMDARMAHGPSPKLQSRYDDPVLAIEMQ